MEVICSAAKYSEKSWMGDMLSKNSVHTGHLNESPVRVAPKLLSRFADRSLIRIVVSGISFCSNQSLEEKRQEALALFQKHC